MNTMWYIHTVEHYSARKAIKLLVHANWVNLRIMMMRERSQKAKHVLHDSVYKKTLDLAKKERKQISG